MQDKEFYQQILGLSSPWKVTDVELDRASAEIRVKVDHPRGSQFCCPECKTELPCHDHAEERRWRHLDSCQFKTSLIARQPRVNCPEHGVKTVSVPWAEKSSRFTLMFVRFAIDVLLATQTVEGACVLLRTTWDETWSILQKAASRGKARKSNDPLPRIGIDEKAFRKGQNYITLIHNLDQTTVVTLRQQMLHFPSFLKNNLEVLKRSRWT